MKEIFMNLYEEIMNIHSQSYWLIFQELFDNGGYRNLGLSFIIIPLLCWGVFYFLWKYPYGTYKSWLLWLLITTIVVIISTLIIAENKIFNSENQAFITALNDPESGYHTYAKSLLGKYAFANTLFTFIVSLIYSLIMKQFSKIQTHLPI